MVQGSGFGLRMYDLGFSQTWELLRLGGALETPSTYRDHQMIMGILASQDSNFKPEAKKGFRV